MKRENVVRDGDGEIYLKEKVNIDGSLLRAHGYLKSEDQSIKDTPKVESSNGLQQAMSVLIDKLYTSEDNQINGIVESLYEYIEKSAPFPQRFSIDKKGRVLKLEIPKPSQFYDIVIDHTSGFINDTEIEEFMRHNLKRINDRCASAGIRIKKNARLTTNNIELYFMRWFIINIDIDMVMNGSNANPLIGEMCSI